MKKGHCLQGSILSVSFRDLFASATQPITIPDVMFSRSKKLAQQTAHRLIAGHFTLTAWWTLRHAGVFEAMLQLESEKKEGMVPLVHAARTNMASDVLEALVNYLVTIGMLTRKGEQVRLTPEAKSLLKYEDPVLELVHAYAPLLASAEHLLARLKALDNGSSVQRKTEAFIDAQAKRYATEVFPAVLTMLGKNNSAHLLDLACGAGDLLMHIAKNSRNSVGVGIGSSSSAVRRANRAITSNGLGKRLLAITANAMEICTDTKRTFDRIGISRQLWDEIDCLLACNVFSELAAPSPTKDPNALIKTLSAIAKNFPKASLLIIEPTASPRFDKNYYAPELSLLLRLSNTPPWPADKWRTILKQSRFRIIDERALTTDGLILFLCKP
ncbi:MAG: hypothetical protein FWD61_05730 [Phycisphaerales bacterium]|nr:hypothetical protein [Phycisphaerales bacterium]